RAGGRRPPARSGLYGMGVESGGTGLAQAERARPVPSPRLLAELQANREHASQKAHSQAESDTGAGAKLEIASVAADEAKAGAGDAAAAPQDQASDGAGELLRALEAPGGQAFKETPDGSAGRRAEELRETVRLSFANYGELEYERARDTLKILQRRLRIRLARRLRITGGGRIDFRRTMRGAIQHGGVPAELRFRNRRPRHVDLLLLGDVSGSMRYAAVLMLELMAGAQQLFRHVRSFVYIDGLAEAGFERGHLVTTPPVDFLARSDFGKVLIDLWERRTALVTRASMIVIIGDGRNNRRPPRAEILRDLRRRCRSILWLNPEPPERWGTGDSAISRYARAADHLSACANLAALERDLARIV
ncbi:MAG TPA: VWA domain-containing protein, partial [Candidatus Binataceae bacterium]|nr:VWA domain-containing protein [Candidatus Binataceae bacterium]